MCATPQFRIVVHFDSVINQISNTDRVYRKNISTTTSSNKCPIKIFLIKNRNKLIWCSRYLRILVYIGSNYNLELRTDVAFQSRLLHVQGTFQITILLSSQVYFHANILSTEQKFGIHSEFRWPLSAQLAYAVANTNYTNTPQQTGSKWGHGTNAHNSSTGHMYMLLPLSKAEITGNRT